VPKVPIDNPLVGGGLPGVGGPVSLVSGSFPGVGEPVAFVGQIVAFVVGGFPGGKVEVTGAAGLGCQHEADGVASARSSATAIPPGPDGWGQRSTPGSWRQERERGFNHQRARWLCTVL